MPMTTQDFRPMFLHRFLALHPDLPSGFNDRLAEQVLAREQSTIDDADHAPIAGMHRTMTTAWKSYNVLNWRTPETEQLRTVIAAGVREYTRHYARAAAPDQIQCWSNVLRQGEKFDVHGHGAGDTIAGTYYVTGDSPTGHAYYQIASEPTVRLAKLTPQPGLLILFQSDLLHGVTEYHESSPRISIAFDIVFAPSDVFQAMSLFDATD